MTKIISARSDDNEVFFLPELLTTASVKSLFWTPRFPSEDRFSQYLPLLYWLVDAARPREILYLGVGSGAGFLGLCQAVDKLDLASNCYGYGPYAPGTEAALVVPPALAKTCGAHFDTIAVLSDADPATAANRFPDRSVDLAVVEMSADAALITSLTRDLPDRLGKSSVLVLHGTSRNADDLQVQAYINRVRNAGQVIEFDWGDGVMLVLAGPEQASRVARLAEQLRVGSQARQIAMTILRRLGTVHWLSARVESAQAESDAAVAAKTDEANLLATKLIDLEAAVLRAEEQAEAASAASFVKLDALEAKLSDADAARAKAEAEVGDLQARLISVEDIVAKAEMRFAKHSADAAVEAEKLLDLRFQELAQLTLVLEKQGEDAYALEAELSKTRMLAATNTQATKAKLQEAEAARAAAETKIRDLDTRLQEAGTTLAKAEARSADAATEAEKQLNRRFHEIAQLAALLEKQREGAGALKADLSTTRAQAATEAQADKAKLHEADARIRNLDSRLQETGTTLAKAEKQLDQQLQDAEHMRSLVSQFEIDLRAASTTSDELATFIMQQDTETQRLRRDIARLEKLYLAVLLSRTWRFLGPVRAMSRLVTGRKRPPPFEPQYHEIPQPNRSSRLARVMPMLRRELASPGTFSQEAKARFLRYQLWGGASEPALVRLEAMLHAPETTDIARLRAASALSTWYDYVGDKPRAMAVLEVLSSAPAEVSLSKDRLVRIAVLQAGTGEIDAARKTIESIPEPVSFNTDVLLIRANLASNDGARLTLINRVFERSGFASLRRIDTAKPLTLDNLTTSEVEMQIADQGLVSVIMPAYNSAGTITPALQSLLRQSYRNLEILVVDDCSTDDTAAIVERIARDEPRVRLFRQDKNAGAYPARNRGLTESRGAFITTHDADDWSHPQKIEEQLRALADYPNHMAAITHWARVRPPLDFTTNWRLSAEVVHWSHSSLLFRREVFINLGGWDNLRVSADTEFIWRIQAAYGKRSVHMLHRDIPFAFALDDETSLTRTKLTHVSTSYFGLRHYYREISRYFLSKHPKGLPPEAKAAKLAMVPIEMHSREHTPVVIDLWLKGDFTREAVVRDMRRYLEAYKGKNVGVSHVIDPLHERDIPSYAAIFCNSFFETLRTYLPRIVLPMVDVTAAQVIDLNARKTS